MDKNVNTLFHLGISLYEAQEYQPAVLCFQEAAELFHPAAQYWLGHCLEWGLGVTTDMEKAFDWYERAAQLGDPQALSRLINAVQESGNTDHV